MRTSPWRVSTLGMVLAMGGVADWAWQSGTWVAVMAMPVANRHDIMEQPGMSEAPAQCARGKRSEVMETFLLSERSASPRVELSGAVRIPRRPGSQAAARG